MNSDEIRSIVFEMARAWKNRDIASFIEFLADDVVWDDPVMQVPAEGREAVQRFSETLLRAFPDFQYVVHEPICITPDGSRCAVLWHTTATHLEPMDPARVPPTKQSTTFKGINLLEFSEARVSRIDTLFNIAIPAKHLLRVRIRSPAGSLLEGLAVLAQRLRAPLASYLS